MNVPRRVYPFRRRVRASCGRNVVVEIVEVEEGGGGRKANSEKRVNGEKSEYEKCRVRSWFLARAPAPYSVRTTPRPTLSLP